MQIFNIKPQIRNHIHEFFIGEGVFSKQVATRKVGRKIMICDQNIDDLFHDYFEGLEKIIIKEGEDTKSLKMVEQLIEKLSSMKVRRGDLLIAVGGGVVGDLVGFVASIYLRGIEYWQVPTTLLAMVDSAIGGKVGINTSFGKNLIGSYYNPTCIIADLLFVKNLPLEITKNGLSESFKHALIADLGLIALLKESPISQEAIARSVKVKIDIVAKDTFEKSIRSYLNVGHTVAHAIEQIEEYKIPHGKAVAQGIYIESFMALKLGYLSQESYNLIIDSLNELGLEFHYKINNLEELVNIMRYDKKNQGETIGFAFVAKPGAKIELVQLKIDSVKKILCQLP